MNMWTRGQPLDIDWRSTQEAEGTPLERVQVVNSGARVQIPPSPFVPSGFLTENFLVEK